MISPLQQVLVHLDFTPASNQRLKLAREVAHQNGAALSVLYATTPMLLALPVSPEGAAGMIEGLQQVDEDRRRQARTAFEEAMRGPGAAASWAETSDTEPIWAFARQALFADLLVLGQHKPDGESAGAVPADFAETVIVGSGRPGLIVPYIGSPAAVGDTVVIAWKPSRESARAVSAAIPLLRRASRVHVLTWQHGDEQEEEAMSGPGLNLDNYLRLHGVTATFHREGAEPQMLGELLLSRLADLEADLLVMGCYGHNRAREWVLGGVTRTVLRGMTVPVLMAH